MTISNLWTPVYKRERDSSYRMTWGEVDMTWCMPRIGVYEWHDTHATLLVGLIFCTLYINLPKFRDVQGIEAGGYGFYFSNDAFVIDWGRKHKFFYYPWSWKMHKHWELAQGWLRDVTVWVVIPSGYPSRQIPKKWKAPYTYVLKNGTVQKRTATYYIDRREWRWRWLMWLPWPRLVHTCIDVEFDGEVGEQSGTWKGGTIGCSYQMKKGELPIQTLRRMEQERKF
jgi:hypothetical protein